MADLGPLPRNLKAARKRAGFTQEEAAEKSGLSKQAISAQERGEYAPSEGSLAELARIYGTTKQALRYGGANYFGEEGNGNRGDGPTARNDAAKYRGRAKLPPRAYERVYLYLEKLRAAEIPEEMIEESERLMIDPLFSKINKRDIRERSEEDLITDIDAAWSWIKEVVEREWGKTLK